MILKKEKRGQAEIMGLLLIVILVAIGFIFYVKFAVSKESSDKTLIQDFKETDLGNSFVNAMIDSSITCGSNDDVKTLRLKDVLGDIASTNRRGICPSDTGGSQERQVKDYFKKILTNTLEPMGVNYNFSIMIGSANDVSSLTVLQGYTFNNPNYTGEENCNIRNRLLSHALSSGTIALRRSTQQIYLRLLICN